MKRIILISLSLIVAISLVACGSNNENKNIESSEMNIKNTVQNSTTTDNIKTSNVNLTKIYNVPTYNIYMNVPNYQEIEIARSEFFVIGRDINIVVTPNWKIQGTTVEQAHKDIFQDYKKNMQNYATIDELKVEKDSKLTINGIEMYKFEGKLACHAETGNYELYTIGYSFVMDGIPCSIEGTVLNKSQPEDMINQVRDTVNAIAQTVRNTK